jgi:hypothetical protein
MEMERDMMSKSSQIGFDIALRRLDLLGYAKAAVERPDDPSDNMPTVSVVSPAIISRLNGMNEISERNLSLMAREELRNFRHRLQWWRWW